MIDGSKTHSSKIINEYLDDHKDSVKLVFLLKGSPQLNTIEECWHQIKPRLVVSEYYRTLEVMRDTISEFCRTIRFKMNIWKYIYQRYREERMDI